MPRDQQSEPLDMATVITPADAEQGGDHRDEGDTRIAPEDAVSAADAAAFTVRATRYLRMNVSLGVLAIIASVAALYLARAFFVPLLIGILASYTLNPVVGWLKACYVPRPVGAALVLAVLVGGLSWVTFSLSDEASAIIKKLPEAARKMRQNLIDTRSAPTALQNMREFAKQLEGATDDASENQGGDLAAPRASERTTWLRDYVRTQSGLLFAVVAQAPIVLLLTYFLLSSGPHFRRKLVGFVGPTLTRKREAIHILDEITVQIQRFLLTMLVSNVLVGVATWLAFKALGLEQAGAWGIVAGVLHSIPYLGPATVAIASGMAAFLQFGLLFDALVVAGAALLVATVVGMVFLPWLQSRFAGVSPTVLFIALLFFGWLWGAWGLLLGSPLAAIIKVICDRVESLKPVGALLGR